jgi:hypothetical protein
VAEAAAGLAAIPTANAALQERIAYNCTTSIRFACPFAKHVKHYAEQGALGTFFIRWCSSYRPLRSLTFKTVFFASLAATYLRIYPHRTGDRNNPSATIHLPLA